MASFADAHTKSSAVEKLRVESFASQHGTLLTPRPTSFSNHLKADSAPTHITVISRASADISVSNVTDTPPDAEWVHSELVTSDAMQPCPQNWREHSVATPYNLFGVILLSAS
jgi:hypothetical protein